MRVELLDPIEGLALRAHAEGVRVVLVGRPFDDDVWRFVEAGTGVNFLAAEGLLDHRFAGLRMTPGFELRDQLGAESFVLGAWLDGALRLTALQIDAERGVVRV